MPNGKKARGYKFRPYQGHVWTRVRRNAAVHGKWLGIVLLVAIYLYGPQLSEHIALTHEGLYLYVRAQQYGQEMRSGFWQPMLLPETIRGAGFAFPVFYPPFTYSLAAVMGKVLQNKVLGVNAALFLSVIVSAVGAYACGYALTRRTPLAALAAVISITVTYRFVNVYVRGAPAESWGSAFYPIAFYGVTRTIRGLRGGWWMCIGLAGALASHTVVTMYFVCGLAVIIGTALLAKWNTRRAVAAFFYGICALGLSAPYVVPQQAYLGLLWASDPGYMWADPWKLSEHAVEFAQLFQFAPDRRFGNSYGHPNDEMPFHLGLGYLVAFIAVWLGITRWRRTKQMLTRTQFGIAVGLLGVSVFMLLFVIRPHWFVFRMPRIFYYLQFPWRLLSVLPLFVAMVTALFLVPHLRRGREGAFISLLTIIVLVAAIPHIYTVRRLKLDITSQSLDPDYARSKGDNGCTEIAEYMPRSYPVEKREQFYIEEPEMENGWVLDWQREYGLTAFSAWWSAAREADG